MHYNPLDKFYKSEIGAVCANKSVTFRVKGDFDSVVFACRKDGEKQAVRHEMKLINGAFSIEISFSEGLYFYYFDTNFGAIWLNDNYVGVLSERENWFQLTVYSGDYTVPKWLYGGVIYQIFPDRFYASNRKKCLSGDKILHENWNDTPVFLPNENGIIKNNDFFGGDIKGIIEKLDYLKSLGVTAIYLNPIFKAYSNHRYDTGDYMTIDPLLGDESDFVELIDKSSSFGIKIILDGVFNHTGSDSLYFNKDGNYSSVGAFQSKDSPYYSWYNFIDFPNKYEAWWGVDTLPAINESNPSFIEFITGKDGVIEKYTKLGIGGWRLDVVDELPDFFVKKLRCAVKGVNCDATIIGEVWEDASNKTAYGVRREYFQGKELDSVMNYPLKNAIINFVKNGNVKELSSVVKTQLDHYPKIVLDNLMNILSTHDTCRLITALAGEDAINKNKLEMSKMTIPLDKMSKAKEKVKIASLLQFTLCGVPCVYYGDEIGMQGYVDPLNRACYDWNNQDKELLNWYKFLAKLRKNYSAFTCGDFEEIYSNYGAYIFSRKDNDSEVLIAVNCGENDLEIEFEGSLFDLITEKSYKNKFTLLPKGYGVFIKKYSNSR